MGLNQRGMKISIELTVEPAGRGAPSALLLFLLLSFYSSACSASPLIPLFHHRSEVWPSMFASVTTALQFKYPGRHPTQIVVPWHTDRTKTDVDYRVKVTLEGWFAFTCHL